MRTLTENKCRTMEMSEWREIPVWPSHQWHTFWRSKIWRRYPTKHTKHIPPLSLQHQRYLSAEWLHWHPKPRHCSPAYQKHFREYSGAQLQFEYSRDLEQSLWHLAKRQSTGHYNFSHIKSESHKFDGYQLGGTLLQVNSSMSSRIVYWHSDEYARWSHVALSAKKGSRVHIISAYRVCQSSKNNAGPNTAYMQQFRAMAENRVQNPKPWAQFFTDLEQYQAQHVKAKDKLIISMNANEPYHPGSALLQWKERNGLTNVAYAPPPWWGIS